MRRDGDDVLDRPCRDDGAGIDAAFLPFVFDRFRQADSTSTRVHGGLGLGLAIVRHLVELHGGTVKVASAGKGHGATFTVRLPAGAAAAASLLAADPEAASTAVIPQATPAQASGPHGLGGESQLAGLRVLVVDDEPDARELLTALLEHHGARVATASCVAEALATVVAEPFDVLVSDIGMPGDDGYELVERLRALDHAARATPALALTGFARPEDGARAAAAGFDAHMSKPVDPVALVDALERLATLRSPLGDEMRRTVNGS